MASGPGGASCDSQTPVIAPDRYVCVAGKPRRDSVVQARSHRIEIKISCYDCGLQIVQPNVDYLQSCATLEITQRAGPEIIQHEHRAFEKRLQDLGLGRV